MDVPNVNAEHITPIHKRAAIRFALKTQEHFIKKYDGDGEITVTGEVPQKIQLTDLLPTGSGDKQAFEVGVWKIPYSQGDRSDPLSGGFEGVFKPGVLTLKRQLDAGYEMRGTLHKGSDQDYSSLVQKLNAQAAK